MTNYQFRNGAHVSGVDANTVGTELTRIYADNGELSAPLVVDEARPDDAPLHPAFEWDDQVAAELHREHQARTLIRSVQIIRDEEPEAPSFVHVRSLGSYVPSETVAQRIDLYEEAWRDAMDRLSQAQHALKQLEQLAEDRQLVQQRKVSRARRHLDRAQLELTPAA